jgi:ribosomal protein S18 acetylase RimI-like enzyme
LYVADKHRGKGIGSRTLKELAEYGRSAGFGKIYLHVGEPNKSAIDHYIKNGYYKASEETADLGNGSIVTFFVMEYDLSNSGV